MPGDLERLRLLFRHFAVTQARGRSAVYETLAEGIADDDALLSPLLAAPAEMGLIALPTAPAGMTNGDLR